MLVSDIPPWLIRSGAFLFGALWGSFFNVAIHRWPRGLSVVSPRSQCPACDTPIPAYRNLPIVTYLIQGGKAACCGARMSPRYFIVELLGGLLCLALAQRFLIGASPSTPLLGAGLEGLVYFAFVGGLLIATFVDLEHMEIPDEVSLPCAALGLLTAGIRPWPGPEDAALGAGMGFLIVQLVFVWSYEHLTGRRGMGEGDAKLLMMIGAFLGWQGVLFALVIGAAQGVLVAVPLLLSGRRIAPELSSDTSDQVSDDTEPPPTRVGQLKLPFGPFLSLAALQFLFFGDQIVNLYVAWITG